MKAERDDAIKKLAEITLTCLQIKFITRGVGCVKVRLINVEREFAAKIRVVYLRFIRDQKDEIFIAPSAMNFDPKFPIEIAPRSKYDIRWPISLPTILDLRWKEYYVQVVFDDDVIQNSEIIKPDPEVMRPWLIPPEGASKNEPVS